MSMRTRMFDRATVQRNSETGTDTHGNPLVPVWAFHLTLPCRIYNDTKARILDGEKVATVEILKIAFPLDADVTEDDRITEIKDRRGADLYISNFQVIRERKRKYTHYEAVLKVIE